jgi:hypothetical protein
MLGAIKIVIGLSRHKPVAALVVLCVISVFVACVAVGRAVHRSRRGDRALAKLQQANSGLAYQADRRAHELSGDDLVLALGTYGMSLIATGPLAELPKALQPPSGSSGCGGGGCGGGGGGCGGGCGGCG